MKSFDAAKVDDVFNLGWFPEGGSFDRFDKAISIPVFKLQLGKLEWILSIPGCWFGLPIAAWFPLPLWIGFYATISMNPDAPIPLLYFGTCIACTAIVAGYWFYCLSIDRCQDAYTITRRLTIPLVFGPSLLCKVMLEDAYAPVCFVISSWFVAETLSQGMKSTSLRTRPVVSMYNKLKGIHRELPTLQRILLHGETVFHSLPSGDACGAAVFSTTLYLLDAQNPLFYLLPCVLSSFGRVYFHAHHVSDVLIGDSIGMLVTLWLNNRVGLYTFTAIHSIFSAFAFILFMILFRRFFHFEIPEKFNKDSIYGTKLKR